MLYPYAIKEPKLTPFEDEKTKKLPAFYNYVGNVGYSKKSTSYDRQPKKNYVSIRERIQTQSKYIA